MDRQTPNENREEQACDKATAASSKKEKKEKKDKKHLTDIAFFRKISDTWARFMATKFGRKMGAHFEKHGYLYFSFLVPSMLFFFVFILQGTYPFGDGSVLVLDLNGQYVYFFEALRKAIYGDASLLYSWCGTLGGEFIGIYAYYLASPLSYLVALFPATAMTEFLLFLELLKCGLCGLTMAYYLHKTRPMANEMITISIAVMYALCAYVVAMGHNTMWMDALILLPLVVYGIERLINYGHFKLFIVTFALTMLSNFYIGYMTCYFVLIYFFYYYFFGSNRKSSMYGTAIDGNNNFINEKNHFIKSLLRIGAASVISLLIACAILLPTYYSLTLGKTTFTTTNWSFYAFKKVAGKEALFKFTPIDFISKLFIASYDNVSFTGRPFVYCGMFALILVPVYFISKRVSRRQKVGAALILGVLFLSMMIAPLDLVWHGFQKPNWLNYRYSFMFSFMMLVFAHRGFELLHTVKFKKTVIVASVWAFLVIVCSFFSKNLFEEDFVRRQLFFILIPLVLLLIYTVAHRMLLSDRLNKAARASAISTLSVIICIEMFIGALLNTTSLNDNVTFSPKYTSVGLEGYDNYLDKYRPIVDAVLTSDTSFYRMEKDDLRKYADNYALSMRGTTGSTSTLNSRTIDFLHRLGYISQSNISSHKGATSVADSLLGIKYLITTTTQEDNDYYLTPYEVLIEGNEGLSHEYNYAEGSSLYSYLNQYALSIAYAASSDVKEYNITDHTSPFTTMNKLITALLGEDETVEVFKAIGYTYDCGENSEKYETSYPEDLFDVYGEKIPDLDANGNVQYKSNGDIKYKQSNTDYLTFKKNDDSQEDQLIYLTFTVPEGLDEGTEILFKVPTKYTREAHWSLSVNDEVIYDWDSNKSIFISEDKTDCILSLGTMKSGDVAKLTLKVSSQYFYIDRDEGNGIFYYVDDATYQDAMTRLAAGNLQIEEYTESSFKGTVRATEASTTMFTTIPYEKYWEVLVDGKPADTYMTCAALLAFDLGSEGTHTVEITYRSQPLLVGINLAVAGITLFVIWVVLDTLIFRKKRLANATLDYTCLSEGDYESDKFDEEIEEETRKARRRAKKHKKK